MTMPHHEQTAREKESKLPNASEWMAKLRTRPLVAALDKRIAEKEKIHAE